MSERSLERLYAIFPNVTKEKVEEVYDEIQQQPGPSDEEKLFMMCVDELLSLSKVSEVDEGTSMESREIEELFDVERFHLGFALPGKVQEVTHRSLRSLRLTDEILEHLLFF